ncbi:MAG: Wzy polymerase domain-containing protein [Hylemonella sp.]
MAYLLFSILLTLGWLVPHHFPPWLAFNNEVPVFAGLLLAGLLMWLRDKKENVQIGALHAVVLLLLVVGALQYLMGLQPFIGDLWVATTYLGGFAFAWTLGDAWALDKWQDRYSPLDTLALAFVAGGAVSASMGIIQWAEVERNFTPWIMSAAHTSRALANLAQPNQLSTLLLMGIVAAAILREREKISFSVLLLLVTVQSVGVVLTQSRTGLLVVVVLSLWYLVVGSTFSRIQRHGALIWGGALWLAAWAFQSLGTLYGKQVLGEQMLQAGLRPLMWRQFADAICQSPWLGYGWLQTQAAQQQGALNVPGLEQASYAHNHILDLAIWIGLPLTALVIGVALATIWHRRHAVRDKRVVMLATWLLPLICHAMLELPLAYAYFLLPAGVMMGMLDRWTRGAKSWTMQVPRWGWLPVWLIYAGLTIGIGVEYMQAEEDYRVARFEQRGIGQSVQEYQAPNLKLLTQLDVGLKAIRIKAEHGMKESDIKLLKLAAQRYPWVPTHFQYALALGLNGKPEDAAQQLNLMKGLFGPLLYAEIRKEYVSQQRARYPQLEGVKVP